MLTKPWEQQGRRAVGFLWLGSSSGEVLAVRPLGSGPPFLVRQSWEDIQGQLCALESGFSDSSALSLVQEDKINLQFHTLELQVPNKVQRLSGARSLFGF